MGTSTAEASSDEELMRRVQDDDPEAFSLLYDRLAPTAIRVALGVLNGDHSRAEDAMQESFVSLWRSRGNYRAEGGSVHAWSMGIVRNRAIDTLRRNSRHDNRSASLEGWLEQRPASEDVESDVIQRAVSQDMRSHLAVLPVPQREVIVLAFYGQLSHTEIARQLALPVGTVKGRMRLGLTRLRERLD